MTTQCSHLPPPPGVSTNAIRSFAPLGSGRPRVLILGSMPGQASLQAAQYYAHPRNRFWPLLQILLESPVPAAYPARGAWLEQHQIAVWDVLAECRRRGSLDTAIEAAGRRFNPLDDWLAEQPQVQLVALNGGTAARLYARRPRSHSAEPASVALPSTSPANARCSLADLVAAWSPVAAAARSRPDAI